MRVGFLGKVDNMRKIFRRCLTAVTAVGVLSASAAVASPASAAPLRDIPAPAGSRVAVKVGTPDGLAFGNVTVASTRGNGYLTAWPCNQARPTMSVANYTLGVTRATGVAVRADSNGDICFYTSSATHIVYDQQSVTAAGVGNLVAPARVLDTRTSNSRLKAYTAARAATGAPGGSVAVVTATAVNPDGAGWLQVYPCDQPRPASSHVTFNARTTTANTVAVKTDPSGNICVFSSAGADIIVDRSAATRLVTPFPYRTLDTRTTQPVQAGGTVSFNTNNPNAVLLANITAVSPAAPGWVAAYPCTNGRGGTSTVNIGAAGSNISNFAEVAADANGNVCLYSTVATHLIFDTEAVSQNGTIPAGTPSRKLDTRALDVPLHPGTGKPFTATVSRWYPTVITQLERRGLPATYSPGVLAQITQESSGVPDAVNNWDSNWQKGIASFGLLQTIYPTFNTYAEPVCKGTNTPKLVNGIWQQYTPTMVNPDCNIGAGLSYVQNRYGLKKFDLWNTGNNPAY